MANHHPIKPFPSDIDRDEFGHWLSGFVDGEGCFRLATQAKSTTNHSRSAVFKIGLRSDEREIIEQIRSYFGIGTISEFHPKANPNPMALYGVNRSDQLKNIIVPHFEKHPLRAKKKRDFEIWRMGVELLFSVRNRKCDSHGRKWRSEEIEEFAYLESTLKNQRQFKPWLSTKTVTIQRGPIYDTAKHAIRSIVRSAQVEYALTDDEVVAILSDLREEWTG